MFGNRNTRLSLALIGVVIGMVCLSFAAVPLYRAFCAATGYYGTTRRVETAAVGISAHTVDVRFDASVSPDLPWRFFPEQKQVTVHLGEPTLVYFRAENTASVPVKGQAVFNVLPLDAGQYFNKIQCFCFNEQTLKPGETAIMPVIFFVDPKIRDDEDTRTVDEITLSYTFYPVESGASAR
jgi:cytochrome c oxidase assembly protein subunit 11